MNIFFIYRDREYETLIKSGVFNPTKPVIQLNNFHTTTALLGDIVQLMKSKMTVFPADKLDLLCWRTISEASLRFNTQEILGPYELVIKNIADFIKRAPLDSYDFREIAKENGMALPTFRRYWLIYMGVAPYRYISDLKLSMACELLLNTNLKIGEIASNINFKDALYFSRYFKIKTGLTPMDYRSHYQSF